MINPEQLESKKHPHFSDLDVKGREIAGLMPKRERFSSLMVGSDITILKRNERISSNTAVESLFLFLNPSSGSETRVVQAPHWRTISTDNIEASISIGDRTEFFYTANTKGVGYLKPSLKGQHAFDDYREWNRTDEYGLEGAYGLADKQDFFTDASDLVTKSQWLTEQGLRTELYVAIGRLKKVYYQGKTTTVSQLRKKGVIPDKDTFIPEMGIRLLKTNSRIAEVMDTEPTRARELFENAFDVFNRETEDKKMDLPTLRIGRPELEKIFFKEFFKRMGKNMAVLQNIGYIGWHMHSANVTLAAEIVDIGPYRQWKDMDDDKEAINLFHGIRRGILKDFRDIAYDLKYLVQSATKSGLHTPAMEELAQIYLQECISNLEEQHLRDQESIDPKKLELFLEKITKAILIERRNLPALKHGADISDWGII